LPSSLGGLTPPPEYPLLAYLSRFAVRARITSLEAFLDSVELVTTSQQRVAITSRNCLQAFDSQTPYQLRSTPSVLRPILLCHSIADNGFARGRNYEPAVHHLRLSTSAKVPPNPGRTTLPQETLGLRRRRFSLLFALLIPAFALPSSPAVLTGPPSAHWERSLTTHNR